MKHQLIILSFALSAFISGCKKFDNRDTPDATITGTVMYNKQPLSIRSGGVELELWQDGYQLRTKIPVYVNQDGKFSAKVFNGNYKLTLLKGNGPWVDKTDTISVSVQGSADVEVPVEPYFIISNPSFQRSGNTVTATFSVQAINTSKALESVTLYIGQTVLVDQNNNAATAQKAASTITDLSQPITLTATIPSALVSKGYAFVRVGVKAMGVQERIYTMSQEIASK